MLRPRALVRPLAALALLAGCAAPTAPDDAPLRELEARHDARLRAYEGAQRRLAASLDQPMALPFDRRGTLLVHALELLGGPGRAYVQARFTYVNTTGESVPVPTVVLALTDGGGREVAASALELLRPLGNTFAPDNAYTGSIDADMGDLYLDPGWGWSLDLELPDRRR